MQLWQPFVFIETQTQWPSASMLVLHCTQLHNCLISQQHCPLHFAVQYPILLLQLYCTVLYATIVIVITVFSGKQRKQLALTLCQKCFYYNWTKLSYCDVQLGLFETRHQNKKNLTFTQYPCQHKAFIRPMNTLALLHLLSSCACINISKVWVPFWYVQSSEISCTDVRGCVTHCDITIHHAASVWDTTVWTS